jgi:hypothetical protein
MGFDELVEKVESYNRTYSGSSYNQKSDVSGFMGQVSSGQNSVLSVKFPDTKSYKKKKKTLEIPKRS